ncbi:MAG: L-aspartate oxidase [Paracoccaceae bacterium]|jgi:L-aspartate oxidase
MARRPHRITCTDSTRTRLHEQPSTDPHRLDLDRYLVPFALRQVPQYRYDVIVVGSGAAGSFAALSAAAAGASVAVVVKDEVGRTNTSWAQGGVAAVLSANDSIDSHVADTLAVGCGLSNEKVTRRIVEGGPGSIRRLLDLGAKFDSKPDGTFDLSMEGGHSHARILHARGDATGAEIQATLTRAIEEHPSIDVFPDVFCVDVLTGDDGRAVGVLARDRGRGELVAYGSSQVVLATGGGGQIYRETTNPTIATADGVAMGVRAGASVRDLEFVQFHPTCLYIAGAARVLISEIVRGAGGMLRDRDGHRFMLDEHPDAELAPRDIVSRAVSQRMVATGATSVGLDLSAIDRDPHEAFPGISRICRFFGIDIAKDPIPVRPGCHYMVGGLKVDAEGRTTVPGLWAVGECSSTGLHGANRMGSNSLLEALVLGETIGELAAQDAARSGRPEIRSVSGRKHDPAPPGVQVNIADLTYSMKSMMWRQMGVERSDSTMREALGTFAFWSRAVASLPLDSDNAVELVNMLTVARLATFGALERTESRGTHFRTDYPERNDEDWCAHLEQVPIQEKGGAVERIELRREKVATSDAQGSVHA